MLQDISSSLGLSRQRSTDDFDFSMSDLFSPQRAGSDAASTATPSPVKPLDHPFVLPNVVSQIVSHLPPDRKADFKEFGRLMQLAIHPLRMATLCSGTDVAIDTMKAIFWLTSV